MFVRVMGIYAGLGDLQGSRSKTSVPLESSGRVVGAVGIVVVNTLLCVVGWGLCGGGDSC